MFKLTPIEPYKDQERVDNDVANVYLAKNWVIIREGKKSTTIGVPKDIDELFEDRVRRLFREALKFPLVTKEVVGRHEIDCLAVCDDGIVVVEAKTKKEEATGSIKGFLDTLNGWKSSVNNELRSRGYMQPVIFLLCLENIIPSEDSNQYAKEEFIYLWTERHVAMLEELYKTIGPDRTKQHLLHDFRIEEKISTDDNFKQLRYPAVKSEFSATAEGVYSLFMSAKDLLDLCYVHRISGEDPAAYQRMLNKGRLEEIGEYIEEGNTFSSAITIAFDEKLYFNLYTDAKRNGDAFGLVYLPKIKSVARVIDGQHRLYGYTWASKEHLNDKVPVVILSKQSPADQARVFIDINKNQKPVDMSTLHVIMSNLDPYGTGLFPRVVRELNAKGLFKGAIKIAGINEKPTPGSKLTITNITKDLLRRKIFEDLRVPRVDFGANDKSLVETCKKIVEDFYTFVLDTGSLKNEVVTSRYIYSNVGFSILAYVLKELIAYDDNRFLENTYRRILTQPLLNYFSLPEKVLLDTLSRSNEASFRQGARTIIEMVHADHISFGAKFLEANKKTELVPASALTEHPITVIERKLKHLVREKLGGDEAVLYSMLIPRRAQRLRDLINTDSRGYRQLSSTPFDRLDFLDIKTIIHDNFATYADVFGSQHDRDVVIGDIDRIKYYRDKFWDAHSPIDKASVPHEAQREFDLAAERLLKKLND